MSKEMCWLSRLGTNGIKILHLREAPGYPWQPYTASPHAVPDYPIPGGSKGWATFQKLRQAGWTLVDSPGDQRSQDLAGSDRTWVWTAEVLRQSI